MVQIISNLGGASTASFDPVIVIKPILVALWFPVRLVFICRFVVAKAVRLIQAKKLYVHFPEAVMSINFGFIAHMCLLVGIVAGATYAGTSGLFAAYLAGASISWHDELLMTISTDSSTEGIELQDRSTQDRGSSSQSSTTSRQTEAVVMKKYPTGEEVFERFCKEPLKRVLSLLFFASIGFSIPITKCSKEKSSGAA
ncbi:uncharacterized protein ACHE_11333S [Aspergillus chevalieri]|uniref:Uncharacterized protein n=1 Tax=Aspergillus chevalieri TaxID=182096 RepID=A0A7R7ZK44_ASPCH|nr:uncharacterized protein ACHE_11333S [Aspergillus chevalieri]BCR83931.1 hypothetical protein ACHE_11333S [Aspergillus chevalieri]